MDTKPRRNIILPVTLILLIFSVSLNYYLYDKLKLYISVLYSTELDPLGLSYFQDEHLEHTNEKPLVVFFGDSRAQFWTSPLISEFVFVNRGLGNQTSAQIANRFDEHVKLLKPDIVILQLCINDIKTIPLFPNKKQEIVTNCIENIQRIVQDSLNTNATVIVTTVIPPTEEIPLSRRLIAWSDDVYSAVDEVNTYILSMSGEHLIVFDTAKLISNEKRMMKPEYSSDHLHLNSVGHEILNRELEEILKEIKQTSR